MLHHVSIDADEPLQVAQVLAQLMGGKALPDFPFKGSCMATAGDEFGTAIEIWQRGMVTKLDQEKGHGHLVMDPAPAGFTSFHMALSVALSDSEVYGIANKAGWSSSLRKNGPFDVIEIWIENRFMLEVLTPDMAADYLATHQRLR